jgi:hypothetical protein
MMRRLFLYFAVVAVIVIMATSFNRFVIDKKKTVDEVMVETSDYFKAADIAKSENEITPSPEAAATPLDGVEPQFKTWFGEEAGRLSSTQLSSVQKENELRQKAKSFSARQLQFLKDKSTDSSATPDEKILSTYLLSLVGDVESLGAVASQALKVEAAEPHSLQEIQNNQERAKAIMAIDAIAESDRPLSLRIDELRKIINKQNDVTVKNYAQRKQSELQSEL